MAHPSALCSKKPLATLLMQATPVLISVDFPGSNLPAQTCWNFDELAACLQAFKEHPGIDGQLDVVYAASEQPVAKGQAFKHERTFFVRANIDGIHLAGALIGIDTAPDRTLTGVQFKSETGLKLHVAEHEAKRFCN